MSKYTEGVNEKELRPNGLPKSLIRYDGKHDCSSGFLCECYFTSLIVLFMCQLDRRRRH